MTARQQRIKLIALDMDGTLLDENGEISEANREAINQAQSEGIYVVLSTGRTIRTCSQYAESLKLSSYLVTVNGSEIWGDRGELVERHMIHSDLIQWMYTLSQQHETSFWAVNTERVWREIMPNEITTCEWLKFGFDTDDQAVREKLYKKLVNSNQLEISNSSPTNLEVNAKGINKARAIRRVCRNLDISMDDVMAVGDSLNDLAMITEAGYGIAMGNAQETVKKAADFVTGTNIEDGVAEAIWKWVLE
ncbi:HAD family phosphatase [Bacillus aquiflavi]|uniref:HAD family phosphatase n=1 Tax=Bacillus aquiflavi TaxID=2672567 RepID=A0A6B3VXN9_9BACI|nr:Cof-type HAD-IIB family hydrolase [Bacillus aquiflavi]MBA4537802.1 HAD family phosphatase [Bacillus aquiflavi]NEY82058.1 HAD family phosphatase [Bacillus aquiflavi]UAC48371.1 Cof-type HAD-IIB family hydrolase [Bacillus aquiflavi]